MFRVKEDLATWFNALFMALFLRPLWVGLLFLRLWRYSSSLEKVSLGGVLDLRLYVASPVSSEDSSEPGDERFRRARCNSFFNSSISRCMSLSFFAWETWLFPRDWLLLVCVVCVLPSWSSLCWGFTTELWCWEPPDFAWCGLTLSGCGPIVSWCEPNSSISSAKPGSPSDQIKFFPQTTPIIRTSFGLDPKTGLSSGPTSPNNEFVERGRKN